MGVLHVYQTYRRVNVSGGVGLLYYLLLLAILGVIVVHLCGTNKAHLHLETQLPGTTWARLQQPAGVALRCSDDLEGEKCEFWDWLEVLNGGPQDTFVATFVQERLQKRICPRLNATCGRLWEDIAGTEFYVASPEQFELVLEHRVRRDVYGHQVQISAQSSTGILLPADYPELQLTPTGLLFDEGQALRRFANCSRDILPLTELLQAANVTLRDPVCVDCGDLSIQGLGRSLRRWGLHLDLTIVYSNLWANLCQRFTTGEPRYAYTVQHLPVAEGVRLIEQLPSSPYLPAPPDAGETRIIRRIYGIRVAYHQTGLVGVFCQTALLSFIIGCITLLGLPWTLTELYVSLAPFLGRPAWYRAVVADRTEAGVSKKTQ